MTCAECRVLLLAADRSDLRGESGGPLGEHLRTCARCRAEAAHVDLLTQRLASTHLARDAHGPVGHTGRRRLVALALIPLAATIIGAVVLSTRTPAPLSVDGPARLTTANGVSLRPRAGQRATVIPSHNPKVTIIWLSEGRSE